MQYFLVRVLFLIPRGCDHVSELWPPTGLLFIPQMMYEYGALVE